MNNQEEQNKTKPRMHGPGAMEKPKDLKKATKKMIKYLHNFLPLIIIALILAALSSVFSIVGPNKLSDLTDKISAGLVINEKNLKKVLDKRRWTC